MTGKNDPFAFGTPVWIEQEEHSKVEPVKEPTSPSDSNNVQTGAASSASPLVQPSPSSPNLNYRLIYLHEFLDTVHSFDVDVVDIEKIDASRSTQFVNAFSGGGDWPDFVDWFDLLDTVDWIFFGDEWLEAAEQALDETIEDDITSSDPPVQGFDGLLASSFTPTEDPELRAELGLDPSTKGEIWSLHPNHIQSELDRAEWSDVRTHRLTYLGGKDLAYALYAMRNEGLEKLAAFCLAGFFRAEFNIKLNLMRQLSRWQPPTASRLSLPHLDRLMIWIERTMTEGQTADYLEWSLDIVLSREQAQHLDALCAQVLTLIQAVDRKDWASIDRPETLLILVRDYCAIFGLLAAA